jgi:hypothetical protein
MPSKLRWHRFTDAVLLAAYLPGCATWRPVRTPSPAEYVEARNPERVRIMGLDSSRMVLRTPTVRHDSLVGVVGGGLAAEDTLRWSGMPCSQVRQLEVRQGNTAMVLGAVGVLMLVGALAFSASGGVMGD